MTNVPVERRPAGVTLLGVLIIIAGVLYVGSGLLAMLASTSGELTDNQRTVVLVLGIVIALFGLVYLAVARGLFRGSTGARTVTAVVSVLTVITGVYASVSAGNQRGVSFVQVVIALVVLALLYSPKANAFFGRRRVTGY